MQAATLDFHPSSRRSPGDIALATVLATVAADFGLSQEEMMAPTRGHAIWKPRMAAMYYARLLTDCSLPELGRAFGGRNHTTVLRAFRRCRELMDKDPAWADRMDALLVRLIGKIVGGAGGSHRM
ncbi:MAG: hypothetical protein M0006_11640 [Magnetospirillum sp.]|nr:hypothetical protein [Magnetospirillum sp.]